MDISKIIITGDILRLNEFGESSQDININWLYNLVYPILEFNTDLEIINFNSNYDSNFIENFYKSNNLEVNIENWAKIFNKNPSGVEVGLINSFFENSLVISFEMSEIMRKSLDILKVSYLDLTIHPIRYLNDLIFSVRSNIKDIEHVLLPCKLSHEDIIEGTAYVKSKLSKLPKLNNLLEEKSNVGVFASQTLDDKVLIKNGRFMTHEIFLPKIKEMCSKHDLVVIKPHPYALENPINIAISRLFPNVKFTNENFYKLISQNEVKSVYSITSSTSIEAAYFGKQGHHFSNYPYIFSNEYCDKNTFFNLKPVIHKNFFWFNILKHLDLVKKDKIINENFVNNFEINILRNSISSYWGADILY